MKRFYLSNLEQVQDGPMLVWRAAVVNDFAGQNFAYSVIIPDDPSVPGAFALVIVDSLNHAAAQSNAAHDQLPDLTLDSTLASLSNVVRNNIINKLTARGVNMTGIGSQSTMREVLRRCGLKWSPTFNENAFDAQVG